MAIIQDPGMLRFCPPRNDFYRQSLQILDESGIPFLVGGAFALKHYSGIYRDTKDLDIFILPDDYERCLDLFARAGYDTTLTFTHWLGKATCGEHLVDIIFNSGNAISRVDEAWFEHATWGSVLGVRIGFIPPEEMIWSKGFIMERERYDGADIQHLLAACARVIDWKRLLERFGENWRVLLSHLVLFPFVYPSERDAVPDWVMRELMNRVEAESTEPLPTVRVCRGTLLSRTQFRTDVEEREFADARVIHGKMTIREIEHWDNGREHKDPWVTGGPQQ